jgi:hypothetical protein
MEARPVSQRRLRHMAKAFRVYVDRDHVRWLCELRDHGEVHGVEAQFYQNEEFSHSRRFNTRALAVQWAELERKAIEKSTRYGYRF